MRTTRNILTLIAADSHVEKKKDWVEFEYWHMPNWRTRRSVRVNGDKEMTRWECNKSKVETIFGTDPLSISMLYVETKPSINDPFFTHLLSLPRYLTLFQTRESFKINFILFYPLYFFQIISFSFYFGDLLQLLIVLQLYVFITALLC